MITSSRVGFSRAVSLSLCRTSPLLCSQRIFRVAERLQTRNLSPLFQQSRYFTPNTYKKLHPLTKFILANFKLKKDPSIPVKLSANKANFKRVARDGALKQAYSAMTKRLREREKTHPGLQADKSVNFLPVVMASPGCGKSFFLDELGLLNKDDLERFCDDPEMRAILQNSVVVPITYAGNTPFNEEIDSKGSLGLILRVLYSYYICDTVPFEEFVDQLRPLWKDMKSLCLSRVIDDIAIHSNNCVLLIVDEIMKSGDIKEVGQTVIDISNCLNTSPTQFNVVVSSDNAYAFELYCKHYSRQLGKITLEPPNLSESLSLFGNGDTKCDQLRQCISDCNGHFGFLEILKEVWNKNKGKRYTHQELIKQMGARMSNNHKQLSVDLIRPAIQGIIKALDDSPDGKKTYAEYMASGPYLNDFTSSWFLFVPRLSPLQLLLFAFEKSNSPDDLEADCARKILSLLSVGPDITQWFEHFHIQWECLRRTIAGPINFLSTMYKEIPSNDWWKNKKRDPTLALSSKNSRLWPTHFPQLLPQPQNNDNINPNKLERADHKMMKKIEIHQPCISAKEILENLFIPIAGNPGFNIVQFEAPGHYTYPGSPYIECPDSEPIIVCTDCRFSNPKSMKRLTKEDVIKMRALTYRQFSPFFIQGTPYCGLTLKEENLFLIICDYRNKQEYKEEDLPVNTIVLNQQRLELSYSPSLASRLQFILREEENRLLQ